VKIVFDQGTPAPLRHALTGHSVSTAFELGWAALRNGELLKRAAETFDVLITTDQNLRHQQDLSQFQVAVLVLPTTSWPKIRQHVARVMAAVENARPGEYQEIVLLPNG
jgi:precorrin-2 methylase